MDSIDQANYLLELLYFIKVKLTMAQRSQILNHTKHLTADLDEQIFQIKEAIKELEKNRDADITIGLKPEELTHFEELYDDEALLTITKINTKVNQLSEDGEIKNVIKTVHDLHKIIVQVEICTNSDCNHLKSLHNEIRCMGPDCNCKEFRLES